MASTDALTLAAMLLCGLISLLLAVFKLPEFSAILLVGCYYFAVFHISHVVGESHGWYRDVLPTFLGVVVLTILTFALIYYRYGLIHNGSHYDASFLEAIYFSVTTLTTLGYGDFSPVPRLRHITSVQAILGYVGLGLWVAFISGFIRNMAENRQAIREHNDHIIREHRAKQEAKGADDDA